MAIWGTGAGQLSFPSEGGGGWWVGGGGAKIIQDGGLTFEFTSYSVHKYSQIYYSCLADYF